jgi:hypothetical protein
MQTYNPATDTEKIRQAIETVHQKLRDELGDGVTLAQVTEKFNEVYGLGWTPEQVAPFLSADAVAARRAQGATQKAAKAHTLSDLAAQASADARESGTAQSHFAAAAAHEDASRAHRDEAAAYHDRAAAWHSAKATGSDPADLGDDE